MAHYQEEKESFWTIFKDDNKWNEKSIVGFMSFIVMIVAMTLDLVTGYYGKDLVINDYIFNAFVTITLGSFGIGGAEKVFGKKGEEIHIHQEDLKPIEEENEG